MTGIHMFSAPSVGRRGVRLAAVLAALITVCVCISIGAPEDAAAGNFCQNAYLSPDQHPASQDHCNATWGGPLFSLAVEGYEHSVCGATTDVNGGLNSNWFCTPGPNTYSVQYYPKDGWYRRAIIWNHSGGWTHVYGTWTCYC